MARVAMLVAEDYEDSEFDIPYDRLRNVGHQVVVVGKNEGEIVHGRRGRSEVRIERAASDIQVNEFAAVVIPGGYSPDKLRLDTPSVRLVRRFVDSGKVVAAVCHGPQLLIEAEVVSGRTLTSWPSVRKDLINAGAHWIDQEVVEDGALITARQPEDVEEFAVTLLKHVAHPE